MRKLLLTIFALTGLVGSAHAQLEYSAFTATGRGGVATTFSSDYQTLGINPANLGVIKSFRDPFITLGVGEMSINFMAEAIKRRDMFDAIGEAYRGEKGEPITYASKILAGQRLANTDISTNIDYMPIGMSIHLPGHHGIAFSIRSHSQIYMNLNPLVTDLMFMGAASSYFDKLKMSNGDIIDNPRYPSNTNLPALTESQYEQVVSGQFSDDTLAKNLPQLFAGSRISASVWNEFNFGYGKRIYDSYNLEMYAGIGFKVIKGILLLDVDVNDNEQIISNYASIADNLTIPGQPTLEMNPNVTVKDLLLPKGVANGVGYDLGFTAVVKKNLTFGMALNNFRGFLGNALPSLGQIISNERIYQASETDPLEQSTGKGLDSYNVFASNPDGIGIGGGDGTAYEWAIKPRRYVELPATFRTGMSYNLLKTLHFGFDIIIPLNNALGNPGGPVFAFGGDLRFSRLFRISSGFNATVRGDRQDGDTFFRQFNIPAGITYTSLKGTYEAGVATRDIFTYIGNPDGSTVSFASGFLRFKLGHVKKYRG